MRSLILFAILGFSLIITACDSSFNVVPASNQTSNNGVDAARVK